MNLKYKWLYPLCHVLALTACDNRLNIDMTSPGEDVPVSQPVVSEFKPETQNEIFINIMQEVNEGTCVEDKSDAETRLITADEYLNAIKFIYQIELDTDAIRSRLPAQTVVLGYDHLRQFNILSPEKLVSYRSANEAVMETFINQSGQGIVNCGSDAVSCVRSWLEARLPIIWRKEIDETTINQELAFFTDSGGDLESFRSLNERLLLSPYFLYRRNFGLTGQLTSWEVATTLSDVLWAGQMNDELINLANQNQLSDDSQINQQVQRMISDAKFYDGLKNFVSSWLTTEIVKKKNFTEESGIAITEQVKNDLTEEATAYLYYLVRNQQDDMAGIFTSPFTIGSSSTGQTYGFAQGDSLQIDGLPNDFFKLDYTSDRAGLLSQPSFAIVSSNLAKTNPALRGKNVLEKFLCHNLETPENLGDIVANTQFDTSVSVIEAFDKATSAGSCGECHQFINGIGYAMEDMSFNGLMQTIDNHQQPVVPDGNMITLSGETKSFSGISGLNEALGSTKDVEVCIVVQAFRMVHGRLEEEKDVCSIASAYKNASQDTFQFHEVFTSLLTQKSFLTR